jgi:hypothetical protein
LKTVYERSNLGKFRAVLHRSARRNSDPSIAPHIGPLGDYAETATLARAWAAENPGANIEVVQVTDQYRGAIEVVRVEEINSD